MPKPSGSLLNFCYWLVPTGARSWTPDAERITICGQIVASEEGKGSTLNHKKLHTKARDDRRSRALHYRSPRYALSRRWNASLRRGSVARVGQWPFQWICDRPRMWHLDHPFRLWISENSLTDTSTSRNARGL